MLKLKTIPTHLFRFVYLSSLTFLFNLSFLFKIERNTSTTSKSISTPHRHHWKDQLNVSHRINSSESVKRQLINQNPKTVIAKTTTKERDWESSYILNRCEICGPLPSLLSLCLTTTSCCCKQQYQTAHLAVAAVAASANRTPAFIDCITPGSPASVLGEKYAGRVH